MEIGVNTLTSHEVNCLGQAIERTWGRSSYTGRPYPGSSSPLPYGVTAALEGNIMTVKCVVVINLLQNEDMRDQVSRYDNELKNLCNEFLKSSKAEFKEMSGRALKSKQLDEDDSIEMISMSAYTPKRTAYYRKNFQFQVS